MITISLESPSVAIAPRLVPGVPMLSTPQLPVDLSAAQSLALEPVEPLELAIALAGYALQITPPTSPTLEIEL